MFFVSLAITDLIVGLIVRPINAIFTEEWLFGVGGGCGGCGGCGGGGGSGCGGVWWMW